MAAVHAGFSLWTTVANVQISRSPDHLCIRDLRVGSRLVKLDGHHSVRLDDIDPCSPSDAPPTLSFIYLLPVCADQFERTSCLRPWHITLETKTPPTATSNDLMEQRHGVGTTSPRNWLLENRVDGIPRPKGRKHHLRPQAGTTSRSRLHSHRQSIIQRRGNNKIPEDTVWYDHKKSLNHFGTDQLVR